MYIDEQWEHWRNLVLFDEEDARAIQLARLSFYGGLRSAVVAWGQGGAQAIAKMTTELELIQDFMKEIAKGEGSDGNKPN